LQGVAEFSMERAGIEPATSGLQTQPITRPHLTATYRIRMPEPKSALHTTRRDTVRHRSARTALARSLSSQTTFRQTCSATPQEVSGEDRAYVPSDGLGTVDSLLTIEVSGLRPDVGETPLAASLSLHFAVLFACIIPSSKLPERPCTVNSQRFTTTSL